MPGCSRAIAAAAGLLALSGLAHANPLPLPFVETDAEALLLSRTVAQSLAHRQAVSSGTNDTSSSSNNVTAFDYTLTTSVLNNTNLNFQPQPYVSNGYIGARLPAAGVGCQVFVPTLNNDTFHNGTQGWPLFTPRQTASLVSGFYAQVPNDEVPGTNYVIAGGQQVVSLLPAWASLYVSSPLAMTANGTSNSSSAGDAVTYTPLVDPTTVSNFAQSMSIRDGIVQTNATWNGLQLRYTVFAHRERPNVGVMRLDVEGLPADQAITVTDALDGSAAKRVINESSGFETSANQIIFSAVSPAGVPNVTAWEFSAFDVLSSGNDTAQTSSSQILANTSIPASVLSTIGTNTSTVARSYVLTGPNVSVVKYVGIATSDAYAPNERAQALNAAVQARKDGYDALLQEHQQAWEDIWNEGGDVQINNSKNNTVLAELQKNARASWFHILSNLRRGNESAGIGDTSIAPAGLTSDSYAEGIFWDADIWIAPGLLSLYPNFASNINNYRSKMVNQSIINAQQANYSGLLYPWISFRYGNCTGIGPCTDYEYHLNNDIALAHWKYYQSTANKTFLQEQAWPIMKGVSDFWASKVQRGQDGKYTASNMTGPDEYSNQRDNEAFTMASLSKVLLDTIEAADILGFQNQVSSNWSDIAANVTVLNTGGDRPITIEFQGFEATVIVKQADVVLNTYPLEAPQSLQLDPLADLDFYASATAANGPGMTYSIFSIDSAQLQQSGCESFSYFRQAAEPYSRAPYYQFSEQSNDLYAFNNGTNPAFTFLTAHGGYLQTFIHGFVGHRTRTDRFYVDPSLPPQLEEGLVVTGMKYQGNVFDVTLGANESVITMRKGSGNATVEVSSANAKGGNFTLTQGQNITVPTRRVDLNPPAISGNIAQCKTTTTNATWTPGNFDIAAIDGSNATFWQPTTNETAELSVDLGSTQNFSRLLINWGNNPAMSMQAFAGDDLNSLTQIVNATQVQISAPWDAATASQIILRDGNVTDIDLSQSTSGRYVQLVIEGAMVPDEFGHGATVAEFSVI